VRLHVHTFVDPFDGTTNTTAAEMGQSHVHTGTWSNGETYVTSMADDVPNHGHHVVFPETGETLVSSYSLTVIPGGETMKSYPHVLTWEAVAANYLPDDGSSGMPESLEADIPGRYQFWKCEATEDKLAVRRALVESGIVAESNIRIVTVKSGNETVGEELHRVVFKETSAMVLPSPEPGAPVVPTFKSDLTLAADVAGLENPLVMDTNIVSLFGLDETLRRAEAGARDWLVQIDPDSPAFDAALKRYDAPTLYALKHSDAAVYLASGIPDDGDVRWLMKADTDAVTNLLCRQNLSPVEILQRADNEVIPERVADLAEHVSSIAAKRAGWSDYDARVATRAVVTIQRELAKGATADAATLQSLGVDVRKAVSDLAERVQEISIHKADRPDEERIVYGIVLEPDTVDLQGDVVTADTIRKAAHDYMEHSGAIGLQHEEIITGKAKILETFIAPVDFDVGGRVIRKGSWVMCQRIVDDGLWKAVKAGDITGFSIGGRGTREPVGGVA
jgi:hypothetical protein